MTDALNFCKTVFRICIVTMPQSVVSTKYSGKMPKRKKAKKKAKKKKKRANRISVRASDLAWQKIIDDESGDAYYYNSVTQVVLPSSCFSSHNFW